MSSESEMKKKMGEWRRPTWLEEEGIAVNRIQCRCSAVRVFERRGEERRGGERGIAVAVAGHDYSTNKPKAPQLEREREH